MNEMMILIDRNAILNRYQEICMGVACMDCPFYKDGCAVEKLIIESTPVDAESVRHGKWIKGEKIYPDMLNDTTYGYWCSECHHMDVHGDNVEVPFCWQCGAKMDEEEDEDETN